MIKTLLDLLEAEIQKNQFLSGGMLLMVLGAIGVWCRNVPMTIYRRISKYIWMDVEVRSVDPAFRWLSEWLSTLPYAKNRSRLLYLTSDYNGNMFLTPGFGTHWFFHRGRLIRLSRSTSKDNDSDSQDTPLVKPQTYHISVLTRDRNFVFSLIQEAKKVVDKDKDTTLQILTARYGADWMETSRRLKRSLESVVLQSGVGENLAKDIGWFLDNRDWYLQRGVPYRRAYLLHGPPGNGKSSLIAALASQLNLKIAILSLSDSGLNDKVLRALLADIPKKTCVVIEDIDCIFVGRKGSEEAKGVTFSGLLNAIDGIAAGEGHILFMTTNHPEKLDPALIRPGRADVKVELGPPTKDQKRRIFRRFFPQAEYSQVETFAENCEFENMAGIQGHLLTCDNPQVAIDTLPSLTPCEV